MMTPPKKKDRTTEEKIKDAARKVFLKKGYAATRTRDIAEEAGLNLALLNYYFRSKERLFEIIMQEKLAMFFGHLFPVLNAPETTLEQKIKTITGNYISLLLGNPDLPLFILNALRFKPQELPFLKKGAKIITGSVFSKQLKEKNPKVRPEHFFMNMVALCVFPFAMRPGLEVISKEIAVHFTEIMDERKQLIPRWMDAMLQLQ